MKEYAQELKASKTKEDGKRPPARSDRQDEGAGPRDGQARARDRHRPRRPSSRRGPGTGCPPTRKDDKVVCFFQDAQKFKSRYATLGFSDEASLDKGGMWPTSYALMDLTPAEEKKIGDLVKKAAR